MFASKISRHIRQGTVLCLQNKTGDGSLSLYSFAGIAFGVSGIPYDSCVTAGEVYGVNDPSDYAGLFIGASTNFIADGDGGAIAPNGVRAKIWGTNGYMSASAGVSVTYYFEASETWTYGKAPIAWHHNHYSSFFDWNEDGERLMLRKG